MDTPQQPEPSAADIKLATSLFDETHHYGDLNKYLECAKWLVAEHVAKAVAAEMEMCRKDFAEISRLQREGHEAQMRKRQNYSQSFEDIKYVANTALKRLTAPLPAPAGEKPA